MKKVMIWPDIYKEQGHWLPCIHLAKTLLGAGYAAEFMGIPDCQSIVDPYIVNKSLFHKILESVYPLGYSFENKLEPLDQRWKPAHLGPICRGALDSVFAGPNAPNLLISGYFTGLETLLIYYKYNIPFVLITTYLRHPNDSPAIHAKTKLLYMPRALSQSIIDQVVPPDKVGMDIDTFVQPLLDQPELIPCPRDFDFFDEDWAHAGNTHYVEPMIVRQPLDGGTLNIDTGLPTLPPGTRLIYGTSGSQIQDYEFQARQLFKNLIAMMQTQGMDNSHLLLAVGTKLLAQLNVEFGVDVNRNDNALPPNVTLTDWVSQLDVMPVADAVFMHGGLATIKEAIWNEVPMVIVPHGKDQRDNSMRVRRNRLGLTSDIVDLSPEGLRKLLIAATSSTWIKANLVKMRGLFQAQDAAPPSLPIIQAVLPP